MKTRNRNFMIVMLIALLLLVAIPVFAQDDATPTAENPAVVVEPVGDDAAEQPVPDASSWREGFMTVVIVIVGLLAVVAVSGLIVVAFTAVKANGISFPPGADFAFERAYKAGKDFSTSTPTKIDDTLLSIFEPLKDAIINEIRQNTLTPTPTVTIVDASKPAPPAAA